MGKKGVPEWNLPLFSLISPLLPLFHPFLSPSLPSLHFSSILTPSPGVCCPLNLARGSRERCNLPSGYGTSPAAKWFRYIFSQNLASCDFKTLLSDRNSCQRLGLASQLESLFWVLRDATCLRFLWSPYGIGQTIIFSCCYYGRPM